MSAMTFESYEFGWPFLTEIPEKHQLLFNTFRSPGYYNTGQRQNFIVYLLLCNPLGMLMSKHFLIIIPGLINLKVKRNFYLHN